MKQYQKPIILMFGMLAFIAYMSIQFAPNFEHQDTIEVMDELKEDAIQIYVMDQDKMVLPLTKSISTGMSLEDKIHFVIEHMNIEKVKKPFQGLLAKDTKLEHLEIDNQMARLYFNDAFATYDKQYEIQILEAITWAITQFKEIKFVELYLNETKLDHMPIANLPIQVPLSRNIGINHFESATSSLHDSNTITVFYTKEIDEHSYFIPKSKRMNGNKSDMEAVVKEILKNVSITSSLTSPLYKDNIDIMDLPRKEKDTLIVNMNAALLESDRSAKQLAYEALVLSLAENFETEKIMVYVEDQVVSVHGSNEETLQVSSLLYNAIPF